MITEDYISFETAKLLKEKGFYQDFYNSFMPVWHYNGNNKVLSFTEDDSYPSETQEWYSAPTLQMVMKWLREVHGFHIMVDCIGSENYMPTIQFIHTSKDIDIKSKTSKIGGNGFDSYEQACEEAIKYCLENLI